MQFTTTTLIGILSALAAASPLQSGQFGLCSSALDTVQCCDVSVDGVANLNCVSHPEEVTPRATYVKINEPPKEIIEFLYNSAILLYSQYNSMDDLVEEFNSFTGNEDDHIARKWLKKYNNNVEGASTAYFENCKPTPFPAQDPNEPDLEDLTAQFIDITGATANEAILWLLQEDHDLQRAIDEYGIALTQLSPPHNPSLPPTTFSEALEEPPAPPLGAPSTWTDETARKWLATSSSWVEGGLGPHWTGIRILGTGGFGVAGLWQYRGPAESAPPNEIRELCVKQTVADRTTKRDAFEEGRILKILAEIEEPSVHIVRMYGGVAEDTFEGLRVVRLFLEFCRGGDLGSLVEVGEREKSGCAGPKAVGEGDVWEIFGCLAKGVAVMDRGTEDPGKRDWEKDTEICHFDLKTENSKISASLRYFALDRSD
ncbi:hypothetical protein NHQ30_009374 [Ciborinia camelliae]|nr:hypothetical protein NHQ30_009374 [Ciborinia camelliae]